MEDLYDLVLGISCTLKGMKEKAEMEGIPINLINEEPETFDFAKESIGRLALAVEGKTLGAVANILADEGIGTIITRDDIIFSYEDLTVEVRK